MLKKMFLKNDEIKRSIKIWNNISAIVCVMGIIFVIFSPTIIITLFVTLVATGTRYFGLKKIEVLCKNNKYL